MPYYPFITVKPTGSTGSGSTGLVLSTITVTPSTGTLNSGSYGTTLQLHSTATFTGSDPVVTGGFAYDQSMIQWTSSNTSLFTVDNTGSVTWVSGTTSGTVGYVTASFLSILGTAAITAFSRITLNVLVVAGGGGGGSFGAGGGAGGLLYSSSFAVPSTFTVTVGAGGAKGIYNSTAATPGGSSSFQGIVAYGGGFGGARVESSPYSAGPGGGGGSGGGSSTGNANVAAAGTGTTGQGYAGGVGYISNTNDCVAGGGGGAGAAGEDGGFSTGGKGGDGLQYSIEGTPTYYAGGGGGNTGPNAQAAGGLGGGGQSGKYSTAASNGTNGLGGGGGGGAYNAGSGDGGSGVVIIAYSGNASIFTGQTGSVSFVSGNVIHKWDTVGTFTGSLA